MSSVGVRQAGHYLAELLRRPYRRQWYRAAYIRRMPKSGLHHGAIARVLAAFLHQHPRQGHLEDSSVTWEQLETLVSLAVRGERLTTDTLQLFIDAFRMTPSEAARIWRAYEGTDAILTVAAPSAAVPPETAAALRPRRHRTHSVQEHHYIGADRLPYRHETLQVVESVVDGFDRYAYAFDTNALSVQVLVGGRLVDPLYGIGNGVYAVDIELSRPLAQGERHTLQYETTFHYVAPPKPELRRAVTTHIESLDYKITFHRSRLPKHIWWAAWENLEGEIVEQREVQLDEYHEVRYHLEEIENTVVGFSWEW